MGGNAFNSKALHMPRMPPVFYYALVPKIQAQLLTLYARAETPIEGPGKVDHGDVDVLVLAHGQENGDSEGNNYEGGDAATNPSIEDVAKVLGATHWAHTANSSTSHFAIPWPEEDEKLEVGSNEGDEDRKADGPQVQPRHVQVDVFLCPTPASYTYNLMHKAHSDMWVILGAQLRRFGFVPTPTGFYIRITELEGWDKNLSRVKLGDDPSLILRYLGLNETKYWSRFDDFDACMAYIATCRFHDPSRGKEYDGVSMGENKELIAHDRSKSTKRPMFRYWLEEYLPRHRGDEAGSASHLSKEEVVEDARAFFGQDVMTVYDLHKTTETRKMNIAKLWGDLRKDLPCEGSDLTYTMKGLKREIAPDDKDGRTNMTEVQKAFSQGRFDDVREWAEENWEQVMRRQQDWGRAQSSRNLVQHLDRLRLAEGGGDGGLEDGGTPLATD